MAMKIKVSVFNDLKKALRDAAAYERGESVNLRVTRIPDGRNCHFPLDFL